MILLSEAKGTMRNRSKNISVNFQTSTSYDFNKWTPVLWKLWCW